MHKPPPHPMDEEERLEALRRYRILDTDPEPQFDRVSAIAKRQFDAPIALVAFMDSDRNFLKARSDLPFSDAPRDLSFCGHTILNDEVLVVPDATTDPRFAENPIVTGDFHIRFYAGAPLITPGGQRIGTVCIFDTEPRENFSSLERDKLKDLAAVVTDHLEMRLLVGNVHDEIETRRLAEAEARHLAYHDTLTGLPNRAFLQKVIAEGPPFEAANGLAAFSIDLDHFKAVNDAVGHFAGDELLKRAADAITTAVGEHSFVARVSGDEFAVVLAAESRTAVEAIAADIIASTREPFPLQGHTLSIALSLGVAFSDRKEADIEALLRRADLALYEAKCAGRKRFVTFSEEMQQSADRQRRLEQDLTQALKNNEIAVHYQPIHRASSQEMIGVEALARWKHAELGFISPVEFIALAEETGQILPLGEMILRTALSDGLGWGDLFVSVNLSPVQFGLTDLVGRVERILLEQNFPASRLQLEVTEGVLLHDVGAAKRQIESLRELGIKVSLDDFGTGYSSLSYLRSLPFDKVKIDRSFVHGLAQNSTNQAIVQLIVGLARELDMNVTAEGVETEEEAVLLRAVGCTSIQGYYFGRPMAAAELCSRLVPDAVRATG